MTIVSTISSGSTPTRVRRVRNDEADELSPGVALEISWSDSTVITISSETLRRHCPCASCLEARSAGDQTPRKASLRVVQASIDQATNLVKVWSVGNYALGLRFADLHDSGIYTFNLLRELSNSALAQTSGTQE